MQSLLIVCLSLAFIVSCGTSYGGPRNGILNPERAPGTPLEARIVDAAGCRDNYRIATLKVDDELEEVTFIARECALVASRGMNFSIITHPLTTFQQTVFTRYGYTIVPLNETTYNITWDLPIVSSS